MKNFKTKVSALVLTAIFASIQLSASATDINIGNEFGGSSIINASGGLKNIIPNSGDGTATLEFVTNSVVNWDKLNVGNGETLNFNAVDGANGLTILNSVHGGMSHIYGNINSNSGIAKLIISNPNGVLFDGAHFTAAGDVMVTTQPMDAYFENGDPNKMSLVYKTYADMCGTGVPMGVVNIKNSDFSVGGEFNVIAPAMDIVKSSFKVGEGGWKLTTLDGQDYLKTQIVDQNGKKVVTGQNTVRLESVDVDGDVYITSNGNGLVQTVNGGNINGNLTINSGDSVALNYANQGQQLHVTGDVNVNGNGVLMYARNAQVDGNLNMKNGGGFLEVKDVNVGKDMNLTTTAESENLNGYKHFVHVNGDVNVGGNATINSKHNIHIGNYNYEEGRLLDGSFTVGGDLVAHSQDGHVMVTVDTTAGNKMELTSDNLNVLASDDVTLTAKEYQFSSKGYIGGIGDYTDENGKTVSKAQRIIDLMENYKFIPDGSDHPAYMTIAGGEITKLNATDAYIASKGDLKLTGANANDINLTAYRKRIDITGPDVHARNINIGPETDYLKVDFEGRDFTTNYTNIQDGKVITIRPDEVITYELADGSNNLPTLEPTADRTYLIGPDKEITPDPDPINPPNVQDPEKLLKNVVYDDRISEAPVNTPVAFAADLDDDEDGTPIRKNVDGSVTVVRAVPMM